MCDCVTFEGEGGTGTKDRHRPYTVKKWRPLAGPAIHVSEWSGPSGGKTLKNASQAQRMSKASPTNHGTQAMDHEAMAGTSGSKCVVMKWLRYSGK